MLIKVNRISSIEEAIVFNDLKVDIVTLCIDRLLESSKNVSPQFDSRAVSFEKAIEIRKKLRDPNLSIHFNPFSDLTLTNKKEVMDDLNANYYEIHTPTGQELNDKYHNNIIEEQRILAKPIIFFGDGFGYDTFIYFDERFLKDIEVSFIQFDCESIVTGNYGYMKTLKEYELLYDIKGSEIGDNSVDNVNAFLSNHPTLICDKFRLETFFEDVSRFKTDGITLSLESLSNDIYTNNEIDGGFLSVLTSSFSYCDEIVKLIKKIKHGRK